MKKSLLAIGLSTVAACGGAVGGTLGTTTAGGDDTPPSSPSTPRGPGSRSRQALADAVAASYCEAIAACCGNAGYAAVDLATCKTWASEEIVTHVQRPRGASQDAIDACAEAVRARTALCPKSDAPWPAFGGATPSFFLPSSVYPTCARLIGGDAAQSTAACGGGVACTPDLTCAIDSCVAIGSEGEACPALECIDTATCNADGTCAARASAPVGAACAATTSCDPGLVCATGQCAPKREHPEIPYAERVSPYSVRPETCARFGFL